ncbi:MAG: cobalamin-binding protein [Candidatus Dormibacteria bacterium]
MRIVSLLPSATEILFHIGAGDEVVGVTHECDHPAAALDLPRLTRSNIDHTGSGSREIDNHISAAAHRGSSIYALDETLLAELAPDLVVTQELCHVCAVAYHEVAGAVRRLPGAIPVISLEPNTLGDVAETMVEVGVSCGHEREARAAAAGFRSRLTSGGAPGRDRPRVACIEWFDPLMAGGHWVPEMVELAGGTDVLGTPGSRSRAVSWDEVVAAAPDVVLLMPCGFDLEHALAAAPEVTGRAGFSALPAARAGRVYAADGSAYFSRPGPRLLHGLEILAAAVRPDRAAFLPDGMARLATE